MLQDCMIAFNFASDEEASLLKDSLTEKIELRKQKREGLFILHIYYIANFRGHYAESESGGVFFLIRNQFAGFYINSLVVIKNK